MAGAQAIGIKDPFFLSIDLKKAFDSVCRETLWKILRQRGIHPDLVTAIEMLYDRPTLATLIGPHSDWFQFGPKGLKQGCPLSPLLFAIYIDPLLRKLGTLTHKLTLLKKEPNTFPAYGWIDDLAMVLSKDRVQEALDIIKSYTDVFGMEVNPVKTIVLNLYSSATPTFQLSGQTILTQPNTDAVKYLGVYISGTAAKIQQLIGHSLSQDLNIYNLYNFGPADRALIVSHKLVPKYTYRLTSYMPLRNSVSKKPKTP